MTYRKFRADDLFDGHAFHGPEAVLVLRSDGEFEAILPAADAGEDVARHDGWLCPGFVNCHCHLELSHLRGKVPEKTGLVDFVFAIVSGRREDPERIREAIRQTEQSMATTGIVAVGDICNTADTLEQKSSARLAYYNFLEVAGWVPDLAMERFGRARALQEQFARATGDPSHAVLVPHAPYSVSGPLWDLLIPGFAGHTITLHNQETAGEDAFFLGGDGALARMYALMKMGISHFHPPGTTSLADTLPRLAAARRVLLVHNTFTTEPDFTAAAARARLYFCLCPNANLYIEDRLPDLPALLRAGGVPVIGTDSLASNHRLDILAELRTLHLHFPAVPAGALLQWATANGAAALDMETTYGRFAPGRRPGVVLIEGPGDLLGAGSTSRRLI